MKKWLKKVFALAIGGTSLVWSGLAQAVEIEYWQYTYGSRVEAIDKLIESFTRSHGQPIGHPPDNPLLLDPYDVE